MMEITSGYRQFRFQYVLNKVGLKLPYRLGTNSATRSTHVSC